MKAELNSFSVRLRDSNSWHARIIHAQHVKREMHLGAYRVVNVLSNLCKQICARCPSMSLSGVAEFSSLINVIKPERRVNK